MVDIEVLENKPTRASMKRHLLTHGVDRGEGRSRKDYGDGRHPINYSKLRRVLELYVGKAWKDCREKLYAGADREQRHYIDMFLNSRVLDENKGEAMTHCHPDYLICNNGVLKKNDRDYSHLTRLPVVEVVAVVVDGKEVFCRHNGEWKRVVIAKGEAFGGNETKWNLRMGNYVPVNEWVWHKDFFGFNPARDINTESYQGLGSEFKHWVHGEATYVAGAHPELYGYYAKRLVLVNKETKNWLEGQTRGKTILDLANEECTRLGFKTVEF